MFCSCFFFQAEDGIRDDLVTGVQTCALPISARPGLIQAVRIPSGKSFGSGGGQRFGKIVLFTSVFKSRPTITTRHGVVMRSEERRVGKEWRARWAACQKKKTRQGGSDERYMR